MSKTITKAILEKWLGEYQPETLTSFYQIANGNANDSFFVQCQSGTRYVLRKLREQAIESVEVEARIQHSLVESDIGSPLYLRLKNGKVVGRDGDAAFTVSAYIEGKAPAEISPILAQSFGRIMARIHQVLDPDEIKIIANSGQWLNPRNAAAEITRCGVRRQELRKMFDSTKSVFELGLPKAVIHGDLAIQNVFAEGDQIAVVFDFETVDYTPRLVDIAAMYLSLAHGAKMSPRELYEQLVRGYNSTTEQYITRQERENFNLALRYVAAATAAWCYNHSFSKWADKSLNIANDDGHAVLGIDF